MEYAWARYCGVDTYRLNDSINSLSLGTLSTAIKIVGLNLGGVAFSGVEQHWALARLDMQSVWSWIHTRHIPKLGVLEWFLITASNHRLHHAQNARYVDKNYGGLLIVWDRLFGTFEEAREDEPPVYGILGPLRGWNPLWANLDIYAEMLRDAWYTHTFADRLRVLGARIGWRPADVAQRFLPVKGRLEDFRRYDAPLTPIAGIYTLAQFVFLLGYALWMEQHAPVRGFMLLLAMFGYLLLGLVALGALMERAMSGQRWELLRLALTVGTAALLCATESSPVWVIILPIVYVLVSLALALALALMQRMAVVVARS